MPRARNIKPGFFTNDALGETDALARLLFIGLWCHADRAGRVEYRPKKFKVEILPYDSADVEKLINQLCGEFLTMYEVNGTRYLQINNFNKHQNPHIKEASSIIPPPVDGDGVIIEPPAPQPPKEPRTNGAHVALPDWLAADTFRAWIKIRPAKARTEDAQRAAIAKLEKFRAQGLDPNAIVSESLANGWQGIFNPERSKGARGRSAQTLQGSFGRCKYCEREATRRTNGIAHCEEPRHLDNAIQGA